MFRGPFGQMMTLKPLSLPPPKIIDRSTEITTLHNYSPFHHIPAIPPGKEAESIPSIQLLRLDQDSEGLITQPLVNDDVDDKPFHVRDRSSTLIASTPTVNFHYLHSEFIVIAIISIFAILRFYIF